jgi:hypothetical protein
MHSVLINAQRSKTRWRIYSRYGCFPAMRFMELKLCRDVDGRKTIAIRKEKGPIIVKKGADGVKPPSSHGICTGIDKRHAPRNIGLVVVLQTPISNIDRYIACIQKIIREVFFDNVTFKSQTYDKIAYTMPGVDLHDVHDDGDPTNFDHRLGPGSRFRPKPGP